MAASIADGQITSQKMAEAAVGTDTVADGSITNAKLADGSVSTAKLSLAGQAYGVALLGNDARLPDLQLPERLNDSNLKAHFGVKAWQPDLPVALGWDASFSFTAAVTDLAGSPRSIADSTLTAESAFNAFSTALTSAFLTERSPHPEP
jgi:hypothetical protein